MNTMVYVGMDVHKESYMSRIVSMTPEVYDSITNHIRKQLIKKE